MYSINVYMENIIFLVSFFFPAKDDKMSDSWNPSRPFCIEIEQFILSTKNYLSMAIKMKIKIYGKTQHVQIYCLNTRT